MLSIIVPMVDFSDRIDAMGTCQDRPAGLVFVDDPERSLDGVGDRRLVFALFWRTVWCMTKVIYLLSTSALS